ncbi:hypothetical protein BAUCODRAFT_235261 [Baudoinia panamericana UAMH 10762]|uniref:Uncharacterized protein n=1 Tax=Baudoinia panamericana (strain UAMH 10762) TaxID=717646 RepID=M2MA04_BAUPA|nr:uncharacterized protein BAUCODRAFT_235261 [Baudoinia panamericana UAMH 10762]EMC93296.1 hypothetical protein BAUCODRAFT_235261 [Baudoinia panamericana UAMH 10762]
MCTCSSFNTGRFLVAVLSDNPHASYILRFTQSEVLSWRMMKTSPSACNIRGGRHVMLLLSHSAAFETSEPRDRVYALYRLHKMAGIVDFTPPYSMNIAGIYQLVTELVLRLKGDLDVLELMPHDPAEDLPSWFVGLSQQPPASLPVPTQTQKQRTRTETKLARHQFLASCI